MQQRFSEQQIKNLLKEKWLLESELKQAQMDATDWGEKFNQAERERDEYQNCSAYDVSIQQ